MSAEENATDNNEHRSPDISEPSVSAPDVSTENTPSEDFSLEEYPNLSESVATETGITLAATATDTAVKAMTDTDPVQAVTDTDPVQAMTDTDPVQVLEISDLVTQSEKPLEIERSTEKPETLPTIKIRQVQIEPLGTGIVNALAAAVGQVAMAASTVRKTPAAATKSLPKKKKKPFLPSPSKIPLTGFDKGVKSFVSGAGEIAQNGVNIVTGLIGCLQESFSCMGKIIMNPSKKPSKRSHVAQKNAPQPVPTKTAVT